jgi:hypothetical protein
MSKTEIRERADSLYHWILENLHKNNPQMPGIISYWLRLILVLNEFSLNKMNRDIPKPTIEELGTPEAVLDMEVISPQIVTP